MFSWSDVKCTSKFGGGLYRRRMQSHGLITWSSSRQADYVLQHSQSCSSDTSTRFRVSVFVLVRVIMVLWEFTELTFVVLGRRVEILSTAPAIRLDSSQSKSVGCSLERSTSAARYAQRLHLEVWYVDPIINMDPTYAQPKNFNTSSVSKLLSVNSSISKPEGPESRTS